MKMEKEVERYLEYCRYRRELDEKTVKAYRIDLMQFLGMLFCGDAVREVQMDRWVIEEYITQLHKIYKQKTVKRKIASLRAFYNYLEDTERLEENPFRRLKVGFKEDVILPRTIPRKDIEAILNYMYHQRNAERDNDRLLRDIAVVEMLFGTGARVFEVSMLRKDAVDLESGAIRFFGKGGKERYVQLGEEAVIELLREYYVKNEGAIGRCQYFFVNRCGRRFREQSIRDMLKKYARAAGVQKVITPHQFRHSVATYLIEEGVDISYVQQILGHSSLRTTQLYLHIATEKQAEILRLKHPRKRMRIGEGAVMG